MTDPMQALAREQAATITKLWKRVDQVEAWLVDKCFEIAKLQEQIGSEQLRDAIRFHAHLYYNLDKPEILDDEYDKLFKKLQQIERNHPELVMPDSPTQLVGEAISAPLWGRK